MKFRFFYLLISILLISSCELQNNSQVDIQETGVWGPVVGKSLKPTGPYYLSSAENPEKIIAVKVIQSNKQFLFYPAVPMMVGETYQLFAEGKPEALINNIKIRQPCLVFIGDGGERSEIWQRCKGQEPRQVTRTGGIIEDISVPRTGDWIFFTLTNNSSGNEIWRVKPDGSKTERIFTCSEYVCSNLDFNPLAGILVFLQESDMPQIKMLDLKTGSINVLDGSASELKFSPDGKYLSFLDNLSDQLVIIDLGSMKKIINQSGSGLVGEWARDSKSILFGELDYWGGIPGVKVNELDILSGEVRLLLNDQNMILELYQPMYTRDNGVYLVSVRQRNTGPSEQLWLLKEEGGEIKKITNDPLYHYSSPKWNSDYSELVFQRYPINKTETSPQVVIWDRNSDTFEVIAENAVKPFWLP